MYIIDFYDFRLIIFTPLFYYSLFGINLALNLILKAQKEERAFGLELRA